MMARLSPADWEVRLGEQVRRARLYADIDQVSLAKKANISVRALANLENGHGSRLRTLIRVIRALDREDWLDSLEPAPEFSPIALLRAREGQREPKRVARRTNDTKRH